MKNIPVIFISIIFLSCNKTESYSQELKNDKEYIYNYHNDTIKNDDLSIYLHNNDYQLENYIIPISRNEFIKDSASYKNEYKLSNNILKSNSLLKLSYGKVKFEKNLKNNSDSYVDYSYAGFSKSLNSHIINISLFEGNRTLLLNDSKFEYKVIDSEPILSKNKSRALNYVDNEGLSSLLAIYIVDKNTLKLNKVLWSEKNIIDYSIWGGSNDIILKLRNIVDDKLSYYKISLNKDNSKLSYFKKISGMYYLETKVNSLVSEEDISLKFNFYFYNDKKMNLRISTNNVEDAYCEGEYKLTKKDNFIEATYNDKGICTEDKSDSDFEIKEENNFIYIRSKRFINQNWLKLTKDVN